MIRFKHKYLYKICSSMYVYIFIYVYTCANMYVYICVQIYNHLFTDEYKWHLNQFDTHPPSCTHATFVTNVNYTYSNWLIYT